MKDLRCIVTNAPLEAGDPLFYLDGELVGVKLHVLTDDLRRSLHSTQSSVTPPVDDDDEEVSIDAAKHWPDIR